MLSRFAFSKNSVNVLRRFGHLRLTEEFAHNTNAAVVTPILTKESVLPNGIRVISRDNGAHTSNIEVTVVSGTRAEKISQKGAAHLVSASAFIGTEHQSGLRLLRTLDNLGAEVYSRVDREKIVFGVSAQHSDIQSSFIELAEVVTQPATQAYTIEEGKSYAASDYAAFESSPLWQIKELINEAAFGELTPLGRSKLADSLVKLDPSEVLKFRAENFHSGNVIVTGTGISHDTLKQFAEKYLSFLPEGTVASPHSPYVGGDIRVRRDFDGDSYLGLAFPVPQGEAGKPFHVLSEILSLKLGSPSFFSSYSTGGLFGFVAKGETGDAVRQLESFIAELKSAASAPASTLVEQSKAKLSLNAVIALEGPAGASQLASSAAHGYSASKAADFSGVTAESVTAAAASALKSVPTYAVLGKTFGTPTYGNILKLIH